MTDLTHQPATILVYRAVKPRDSDRAAAYKPPAPRAKSFDPWQGHEVTKVLPCHACYVNGLRVNVGLKM